MLAEMYQVDRPTVLSAYELRQSLYLCKSDAT